MRGKSFRLAASWPPLRVQFRPIRSLPLRSSSPPSLFFSEKKNSPSDRGKQHSLGPQAGVQRRLREGLARGVDRGAADQRRLEEEIDALCLSRGLEDVDGDRGDLRANAVSREDADTACCLDRDGAAARSCGCRVWRRRRSVDDDGDPSRSSRRRPGSSAAGPHGHSGSRAHGRKEAACALGSEFGVEKSGEMRYEIDREREREQKTRKKAKPTSFFFPL